MPKERTYQIDFDGGDTFKHSELVKTDLGFGWVAYKAGFELLPKYRKLTIEDVRIVRIEELPQF